MKLGKLLADTLSLPFDIGKDILTVGGSVIGEKSSVKKRLKNLYDDLAD